MKSDSAIVEENLFSDIGILRTPNNCRIRGKINVEKTVEYFIASYKKAVIEVMLPTSVRSIEKNFLFVICSCICPNVNIALNNRGANG